MNFCQRCGTQAQPGDTVCRQCGTEIIPTPASTTSGPWDAEQASPPPYPPPPAAPYPQQPYPQQPYPQQPYAASPHGPPPYPPPPAAPYPPPTYPSAAMPPPPGAYPPFGAYPQGGPELVPPTGALADWGTRAKGLLIDIAIELVVAVPLYVVGLAVHAVLVLAYLVVIALSVYLAVQVGQTGQSPGMRMAGIKCVGQRSGQPIGGGLGVVRSLAHIVDNIICYVGWFFPLWDSQRQTLADKIMSTIVFRVPPQRFSLAPPT